MHRIPLKLGPNGEPPATVKERYRYGDLGSEPISSLAISPSGQWLVATQGMTVYCSKPHDMHSHFTHYISPKPLTCLAFHPFEELFATGDSDGMIRLWYCLNPSAAPNQKRSGTRKFSLKAPTTTLHWHAHAVSGLSFTPNGAYLLSGGEEAVLVLWQLQTGHREFVPRVGAPIEHVTICPASLTTEQGYLLSLVDGSMSFVDSGSLNVTKTFTQVKRSSSTYNSRLPRAGQTTYAEVFTSSSSSVPQI